MMENERRKRSEMHKLTSVRQHAGKHLQVGLIDRFLCPERETGVCFC